jgi:hypothetical protein
LIYTTHKPILGRWVFKKKHEARWIGHKEEDLSKNLAWIILKSSLLLQLPGYTTVSSYRLLFALASISHLTYLINQPF